MKSRGARTPTASVTSVLFLGVGLMLVVACGESTAAPETPVVSVTLSATEVDLTVGDTTRLSAVAHSANGVLSGRTFTWSSDRPGFATVDEAGLVTAVGVGVARIFAATGGQSGQASIRVSAPPSTPVGSVVVEPSSSSLEVGDTVRLHAVVRDAGGAELEGRVVAWASDRVDIASVDATGLVRAHASGTANITATVEEESGSAVVEVAVPPTATPSIAFLNPASIQAGWGNFTLKVQGLDIPPQSRVTWNGVPLQSFYVNSTEIQATVSSSYVQAEGTAEVRVETPLPDSRASNALIFTIFARPALSVDILLSGNATVVGDRVRLHAVARDQFGEVIEGKKITWTSSDTTIAKVEGEFLRGLRVGSVQLRAEAYPTFSGTLFRVVESPVQELAFQGSPSGPPELFRRSLEPPGGVLRFFPPLTYGRDLAVSPDGSRIAFAGLASGSNWDIYTANADGSGLT
ncbi:MAG: Ig-like domain-containing protein, partial [Longimicrobiales bacterium]|nr:Ig-like domain-containing protein [Longimicrobiales bacterium]